MSRPWPQAGEPGLAEAFVLWLCQQLGAQETSATALSNLPVVGTRRAALASELTAGPAPPGLKDISRQVARSAEVLEQVR